MAKATPKWDRHSILAEFRRRGVKFCDFAIENGRNPNTFRGIWTRWNRPNEQLIADFLGDPVEVVWPERYPIQPNRIFHTPNRTALESQKSNVAADTRVAA
ncbi:helix-turn-helix domain-containing protein [Rhizobium pusense]|uniref:helix-turn-helix domain-containing protein n=1 Tax=Agrobacterium pusense TaxID=648995 RepID=UPI0024487496|nr:helix-turn-helix domain-containing protein [Agrobacterium pusense]MDH1093803.1 helix-turn-helix domain-containing protein [Agrobacterium pusense]MDH1110301.1 helix-turn-helix domain-containing protein [Agrobacterium pusense]MDH2193743.1 helix-turn-helix domain-containing protein [Agrobacterium pusense]